METAFTDEGLTSGPPPPSDTGNPSPTKKPRRKIWKPVVGAALVVLIAWQVLHGFTKAGGGTTSASQSRTLPGVSSAGPKPSHVTLGGHTVLASGQPIILLNPGLVAPGGQVGVQGSGFDPGATMDVSLRKKGSGQGSQVAMSKATKDGSFYTQFPAPQSLDNGALTVVAQQRGSDKSASAQLVSAGGAATVSIAGKGAGKPGDHVTIEASGFTPGETVRAYWGRMTGTPSSTLTADSSGSLSKASVTVGLAPVGTTTLVLVGVTSHATALASFQMLGLYPTTAPHPYALQPGKELTYTGSGFAPGEQVFIYFNSASGTPAMSVQASDAGAFSTSFDVPYGLTGPQTLTAIGGQSRASVSTGFTVLPFSPSVQASTYGAMPGTSISFYATGFAPGEVVQVYLGRGAGGSGQLVTAFRVGDNGSAAAAGQYIIPSGSGPSLSFTLVGQKSGGSGVAKVSVTPSAQPVNVPAQPSYVLPPDLGGPSSSGAAAPSSQAPASSSSGAPAAPSSQGSVAPPSPQNSAAPSN